MVTAEKKKTAICHTGSDRSLFLPLDHRSEQYFRDAEFIPDGMRWPSPPSGRTDAARAAPLLELLTKLVNSS
jgi:hypothetical protein